MGAAGAVALWLSVGSGAASPAYPAVTGAVKLTIPNYPAPGVSTVEQMIVDAHQGPNGVSGSIEFRSPQADVPVAKIDVTCLVVTGNDAIVGGTVRQPFNYVSSAGQPPSRITFFGIQLRDDGPPGAGTPDVVHPVVFVDRTRPPTFTPCNISQPLLPVTSGNLTVATG